MALTCESKNLNDRHWGQKQVSKQYTERWILVLESLERFQSNHQHSVYSESSQEGGV